MQKLTNKKRKGFTLVEVIIVVIIIGILAALVIPRITDSTAKARQAAKIAEHRTIVGAVMAEWAGGKNATAIKTAIEGSYPKETKNTGATTTITIEGTNADTTVVITTTCPLALEGDNLQTDEEGGHYDTGSTKITKIKIGK